MLFRKRMWDIMREDFPVVEEDAALSKAMVTLNTTMKTQPDLHVALVVDAQKRPAGVLSMWDVLRAMGRVLEDSDTFKERGRYDAEELFRTACKVYGSTPVSEVMSRRFPVVKPGEPAMAVLTTFLDKGRSFVMVQEAGKVLGVVLAADVYLGLSDDVVGAT